MGPKNLLAILLALCWLGVAAPSGTAEETTISFKRELHYEELPAADLIQKRIQLEFVGSPNATRLLKNMLVAQGYQVVADGESADAKIQIDGIFMITGRRTETVKEDLAPLLESDMQIDKLPTRDYTYETVNIPQIAVVRLGTGSFSPADVITYLGQKSGIAGRFNEWITGNPWGWCWHESCEKLRSHVIIRVQGDAGVWWVQVSAEENNIVVDHAIPEAIAATMKPFIDLSLASQKVE